MNDNLFTEQGYKDYADDLLDRMTNPYLADTIDRAGRDPVRKLAYNDRIFGTMNLALQYGIEPTNMALGALAGIAMLLKNAKQYNLPQELCFGDRQKLDNDKIEKIINWIWQGQTGPFAQQIIQHVYRAGQQFPNCIKTT